MGRATKITCRNGLLVNKNNEKVINEVDDIKGIWRKRHEKEGLKSGN